MSRICCADFDNSAARHGAVAGKCAVVECQCSSVGNSSCCLNAVDVGRDSEGGIGYFVIFGVGEGTDRDGVRPACALGGRRRRRGVPGVGAGEAGAIGVDIGLRAGGYVGENDSVGAVDLGIGVVRVGAASHCGGNACGVDSAARCC